MIKGIYKSASGMIPRIKKQEIAANNIANAGTAGYKKDRVFLKELDSATKANLPTKSDWETPMIDQVYTDFSQGTFTRTGAPLDIAIEGNGFIITESPDGEYRYYTRNGSLAVNNEGYLVNDTGMRVLSDGGPVEVGAGKVDFGDDGQILVDGQAVGQLQVVDFEDKSQLQKVGDSEFTVPDDVEPIPAEGYNIRQGFLESSNINVIQEMVDMIVTMRAFETGAKALQSQDESLRTLLNDVARTRFR